MCWKRIRGLSRRLLHQLPGAGLVMMSMLQNAFSQQLVQSHQSKIAGHIVVSAAAELSYLEFFLAYLVQR